MVKYLTSGLKKITFGLYALVLHMVHVRKFYQIIAAAIGFMDWQQQYPPGQVPFSSFHVYISSNRNIRQVHIKTISRFQPSFVVAFTANCSPKPELLTSQWK